METAENRRFEAALALLEERRFFEAVDAFSELVALSPDLIGAYGNRGLAYFNLGLESKARNDFETVLQLDPEDAMGHAMLAEISRFTEDTAVTLGHVVDALDLDPDEPQSHFIRGWLFARAGQYEPAAADLRRHLELAEHNDDVKDLLDACEALSGDNPRDEDGMALDSPTDVEVFLGRRGWAFDFSPNSDFEEQGLPCIYAHCIRNCPPLSSETPDGCPFFGYACPGRSEQVAWCRANSQHY